MFVHMSVCLYSCLSFLFAYLFVCLYVCLSVSLSVWPSIRPSVHLSVCLIVCPISFTQPPITYLLSNLLICSPYRSICDFAVEGSPISNTLISLKLFELTLNTQQPQTASHFTLLVLFHFQALFLCHREANKEQLV